VLGGAAFSGILSGMKPRKRTSVDWEQVKRRLAATERALAEGAHDIGPDARRAQMRERAQALAAERAPTRGAVDMVEFELGALRLGIAAAHVHEVRHLKELTGIPCTPPFVSGIINAHGRILAVIDLKKLLYLAESGISDQNKVIILRQGDVEFGILADRIVGTTRLPLADLQAAPPGLVGQRAHCVRGIAPGRIVVLDGERLLAETDLVVDDEVSP